MRPGPSTLLMTVALGVVSAPAAEAAAAQDADLTEIDVGYVLGDPDAAVAIVEFGDFACGACAEFWRDTWPSVRRELVETGRVSWRHVPFLLGFDRGDEAANAAECAADEGRFWEMHDRLFERQEEWTRIRRPETAFLGYAVSIGLDPRAFEDCYDAERGEGRTRDATRAARDAGVRGTPTFFVDGRQAVGALPYGMFLELVEASERRRAGPG